VPNRIVHLALAAFEPPKHFTPTAANISNSRETDSDTDRTYASAFRRAVLAAKPQEFQSSVE
jgi:hypothetical protein